jgi:hypothetical protein
MRGRITIFKTPVWEDRLAVRLRPFVIWAILTGIAIGAIYSPIADAEQTNTPGAPPPPRGYQSVTSAITLHHISPVEYFRGILGMTPAQRERALAGKPPEERKAILEKAREYEALPRDVREARLRQTELHWHLIRLMRLDAGQRERQMKEISPLDLPMIAEQLRQWDELPSKTQRALLENERFIETYVEWQVSSPSDQDDILKKLPAARRSYFAKELRRWQALPEDQRAELRAQFQRFFVMTGQEQRQTISTLSDAERRQMERALQAYADLPPAQRQRCIDSFGKFAAMDSGERAQFLQNAEKWEAMTVHERQLWRTLVGELPPAPPAPPGMPPMPPGFWRGGFGPGVTTR